MLHEAMAESNAYLMEFNPNFTHGIGCNGWQQCLSQKKYQLYFESYNVHHTALTLVCQIIIYLGPSKMF
jgi:hypothetical protein